MTNRALPLEIRGFSSQGSFDLLHPLPEKPEESLPLSYLETVREAINSYRTPDTSGRSTPITDNTGSLNNSLSASQTWSTNTGNLTGRSSVYSWGNDDEFDRQASAKVRHMFDEIDNLLFEGKIFSGSEQLLSECHEWCTRYPHLRICGEQAIPPQDDGTQLVVLSPDDPRVYNYRPQTSVLEDVEDVGLDSHGLMVQGIRLSPTHQLSQGPNGDIDKEFGDFEEEVFAEDGEVEEYFAYDIPVIDEDMNSAKSKSKLRKHWRLGYPPVTPNACARDAMTSQIFDQIWGEVVLWLKGIISMYSQKVLRGKPQFIPEARAPERLVDSPLRPVSRDVLSRISYFPSQLRVRTSSGLNPTSDVKGLKDVMMIKQLSLRERAPSAAAIHPFESREGTPLTQYQTRPGSSTVMASRTPKMAHRNSENQMHRYSSARATKRNPSVRLTPLDRPKTPCLQDDTIDVVRGTKLYTGNERLSSPLHPLNPVSPQPWGARSGALPPLEKASYAESVSGVNPARSSAKNRVHFNVRASSAATDDSRRSVRERVPSYSDARPNTTQTFRTDTPHNSSRRLSTPMGNLVGARGGLGAVNQPLGLMTGITGITGVSMPISNSHPLADTHSTHGNHGDTTRVSPENDVAVEIDGFFSHGHSNHGPPKRGRVGTTIR